MRTGLFMILFVLASNVQAKTPQFDSITSNVNQLSFTHATMARKLVTDLYSIAKLHPKESVLIPQCIYWESFLNYSQGIADPALNSKLSQALHKFDAKSFPFENALLLHAQALNQVIIGNYTDALTNSLQALIVYKQEGQTVFKSRVLQLLGTICYRTRNFEMSEKFAKESLSKGLSVIEYYKSMINMYSAQVFIEGKSKQAQKSLLELLPILEKIDNTTLLAVVYLNLGAIYFYSNDSENANAYLKKALQINQKIENESFSISLLVNYSSYFISKKDYKSAKGYITKAQSIASRSNNAEQLSMVYHTLSNFYDQLNMTDSAYYYLKKYNMEKEVISNRSQTIDSYQSYVETFLKSAEKEISIARQNSALDRRRLTLTLMVSISIFLLAISLIIIILQKKRQQALIREAEKKSLQTRLLYEQEIKQMQEDKHKEILDAKVREVTSYSLMLSSKNNVLQEVLQQTIPLKKMFSNSEEQLVKNITAVINDSFRKDQESSKFIHHFNEVHPKFFDQLKSACNDLTENNLRMCAYFKMGMSTKQVATILNISLETVKNGRYRLKKKLGLSEDESLDDFIRKI